MTTDNQSQPTRAMICKRCCNEIDAHYNDNYSDACKRCGAVYRSTYCLYHVGSYRVFVRAKEDLTSIYITKSRNSTNLIGCHYDLTEERIKKLLVLL